MASSSATLGADAQPVLSAPTNTRSSSNSTTTVAPSQPTIPDRFTLFSKLPNELQDMVWNSAIASISPRIVEVSYSTTHDKIMSPTLPPGLLQTCSRSRQLTLRHYSRLSFSSFTGAYINWTRDTLLFNIANPVFFARQLNSVDCTSLYQNCTRLIINAGSTPTRSVLEFGDITRGDEEWVAHPTSPDSGRFVEDQLFGYFEVLEEVAVTHLGKTTKGDGNLSIEMASDDVAVLGSAAPSKGSTRYALNQLGLTFPSQTLVDQCIDTIDTFRVVKLVRGNEKRVSGAAKKKRVAREKMEFVEKKMELDGVYEESLGESGGEEWERKIVCWAEAIPAGPESWPEDWAFALGEF